MARKQKQEVYTPHSQVTKITATSRAAVKIRDNYYTFEATEERTVTEQEGVDIDKEWELLFSDVNYIVDTQCEEVVMDFKNKKK